MKMLMKILGIVFGLALILSAQNTLKVEKIEALTSLDQGEFFYPKLTPDGKKVVVTGPKFIGLFVLDLQKNALETLNTETGAGYDFQITNDGQYVVYRPFEFKKARKFYSLKMQNLQDKSIKVLESEQRELSPPRVVGNKILYLKKEQPAAVTIGNQIQSSNAQSSNKTVFVRNRTIVLVDGNVKRELKPLGEGIYLWPKLSPDGQRIVFTYAGDGTYVCDLNGSILTKIGYANAPTWSPDGKWIAYMVDHDDGHFYTDSEIFISSADGLQKIQVTNTKDVIEMYPNWGSDLSKLVFSTLKGQIFLATLKQE